MSASHPASNARRSVSAAAALSYSRYFSTSALSAAAIASQSDSHFCRSSPAAVSAHAYSGGSASSPSSAARTAASSGRLRTLAGAGVFASLRRYSL